MKGKLPKVDQSDLFRSRLSSIISPRHELCQLAAEIDWEWLDAEFDKYYSNEGRPSIPVRKIVGLLLLKQMYNESDESVIDRWIENPYWQYFTGETYFQHKKPFDPSDFVHFRHRVGEQGIEKILALSIKLHFGSELEEEVQVDTTVQEKNITYPTDTKLALKIINYLRDIADREGIELRQSYRRVVKQLRHQTFKGDHPRRSKVAKKARKKIKTIAGRLLRDVDRKLSPEALEYYDETLDLFAHVLKQRPKDKNKRYSLHEPAVWCIAKGKVHKKYEFGCKVSVARTAKSGVIVGMKSFTGNPFDGHTLEPALDQVEKIRTSVGGNRPKRAVVDRGYRGRVQIGETAILSPKSGGKKLSTHHRRKMKERFRARAGIEPVIGHLKSDHRMLRNYLKGVVGDAVNCLLAGAAFNLRMRLRQIKASIWFILNHTQDLILNQRTILSELQQIFYYLADPQNTRSPEKSMKWCF
ncbi:MAG: IS5 family transposase [Bacteroidota bacterium]